MASREQKNIRLRRNAPSGYFSKASHRASMAVDARQLVALRALADRVGMEFVVACGYGNETRAHVNGTPVDVTRRSLLHWETRGWVEIERGERGLWTVRVGLLPEDGG